MTLSTLRPSYDAVVIGARCAGAATALLLARHGLSVLVVDRSLHGSDTLSTHALMRAGVMQLHRWGVLEAIKAAGTPAVRQTSFHYDDEVVEIAIADRGGVDALYAPRRTLLDAALADCAADAGAEVVRGARLAGLTKSATGRVCGVVLERAPGEPVQVGAGIVIGADGVKSTVAQLVGATAYREGRHTTGVVYGYWSGLRVNGYHWYYRSRVSAGAIPTNDGQTCVFAAVPVARFRNEIRFDMDGGYQRVLNEAAPDLAESLRRCRRMGRLRGFPGQTGFHRQSWGPGWALVGDAGYFKDPITAHGITDALRDAELLAWAVAEGTDQALAAYQATRDEFSFDFFDATDAIASFEWDLSRVAELHKSLSEEMSREVRMLAQLESEGVQQGLASVIASPAAS